MMGPGQRCSELWRWRRRRQSRRRQSRRWSSACLPRLLPSHFALELRRRVDLLHAAELHCQAAPAVHERRGRLPRRTCRLQLGADGGWVGHPASVFFEGGPWTIDPALPEDPVITTLPVHLRSSHRSPVTAPMSQSPYRYATAWRPRAEAKLKAVLNAGQNISSLQEKRGGEGGYGTPPSLTAVAVGHPAHTVARVRTVAGMATAGRGCAVKGALFLLLP
jgi:hypothetical protein